MTCSCEGQGRNSTGTRAMRIATTQQAFSYACASSEDPRCTCENNACEPTPKDYDFMVGPGDGYERFREPDYEVSLHDTRTKWQTSEDQRVIYVPPPSNRFDPMYKDAAPPADRF